VARLWLHLVTTMRALRSMHTMSCVYGLLCLIERKVMTAQTAWKLESTGHSAESVIGKTIGWCEGGTDTAG